MVNLISGINHENVNIINDVGVLINQPYIHIINRAGIDFS